MPHRALPIALGLISPNTSASYSDRGHLLVDTVQTAVHVALILRRRIVVICPLQ